uniref:Proton-coupled amino acid transporter 2-like n=1 Tax=Hirondellea gigas TaxID=1518452 RepID=A0A6A7FQN6_9CRUS
MAGFFIIAQLGGAGFLSLPAAVANTGWIGVPMMVLFCVMVGLSATRLGYCYNMLEERWPEAYAKPARQPYMEIADRAFGKYGRKFTLVCVVISQFGGTAVFIILIAQMLETILQDISTCTWVLVIGAILTFCTWPGTPNDFWIGPMVAVVSTVLACIVIFVRTLQDVDTGSLVQYPNPTINSFALGYGSILFAFGGSSVFPTIQNDMKDRSQFWKSVLIGFTGILSLYLPVSIAGYYVFGVNVNSNILFAVTPGVAVTVAMSFQIVNLMGSFVIGFSTVSQAFEDLLNLPTYFCWQRCVCRSVIVWLQVLICLAIPDFSLILNLIGGSTMTICSFILPPLMYMKLASSGPKETRREIALWMKVALIQIVTVGAIGGAVSTLSAIVQIVKTPFSDSCFVDFA